MKRTVSLTAVFLLPLISHAADRRWIIRNAEIERTLVFGDSGLFTQSLSDLKTHARFIQPDSIRKELSPEFSFDCEGGVYSGHSAGFALLDAAESTLANGNSLTLRLRARHVPMDVTVVYSVYTGHPAIRKYLLLKNTGPSPLHISHLDLEGIGPSVGPANETILNAQYGAMPREIFYTGRSEDARPAGFKRTYRSRVRGNQRGSRLYEAHGDQRLARHRTCRSAGYVRHRSNAV